VALAKAACFLGSADDVCLQIACQVLGSLGRMAAKGMEGTAPWSASQASQFLTLWAQVAPKKKEGILEPVLRGAASFLRGGSAKEIHELAWALAKCEGIRSTTYEQIVKALQGAKDMETLSLPEQVRLLAVLSNHKASGKWGRLIPVEWMLKRPTLQTELASATQAQLCQYLHSLAHLGHLNATILLEAERRLRRKGILAEPKHIAMLIFAFGKATRLGVYEERTSSAGFVEDLCGVMAAKAASQASSHDLQLALVGCRCAQVQHQELLQACEAAAKTYADPEESAKLMEILAQARLVTPPKNRRI